MSKGGIDLLNECESSQIRSRAGYQLKYGLITDWSASFEMEKKLFTNTELLTLSEPSRMLLKQEQNLVDRRNLVQSGPRVSGNYK